MKVSELRPFCLGLLERCSVPPQDAALLVDSLIEAELKGVSSHGLNRLGIYVRRIKAQMVRAKAEIITERDMGAIAVLDGNHSIAQIIGHRAMAMAIDKAGRYGIGAVLAKNSGHFGMTSAYGLPAAQRNMIALVISNVTPLMPPQGGAAKLLGNNPIAVVAPTKGDPIVADMGMSKIVFGKLLVAKSQGKKIPLDWALDKDGNPTDDPEKALKGLLLPIAGPKGYSLAVAIEILTGILAGAYAWQLTSMSDMGKKQQVSHFFLAIDIKAFLPLEDYFAHIEDFRSGIKKSKKAPGTEEIFLPGEIELNRLKHAGADPSITLPENVIKELNEVAAEVGAARLTASA
jgi:LDH2 family malate/lactate/ureidoglycolate dehydrogenase